MTGPLPPSAAVAAPSAAAEPTVPPSAPRTRSALRWLLIVAALGLVVLVGSGVVLVATGGDDVADVAPAWEDPLMTVPGEAERADTRRSSPDAPDADPYRASLDQLEADLAASLDDLAAASTPDEVVAATSDLWIIGETFRDTKAAIPVGDVALGAANGDLLAALEGFGDAVIDVGAAAGEGDICAGGSALPTLGRRLSAAELIRAGTNLSGIYGDDPLADATDLLVDTPDPDRVPLDGVVIAPADPGAGELVIANSGSTPAVVGLVPRGSTTLSLAVYVASGATTSFVGVADGRYQVHVTSGVDWDDTINRFTRSCTFARYPDEYLFVTDAVSYTSLELVVGPAAAGDTAPVEISAEEYPAG